MTRIGPAQPAETRSASTVTPLERPARLSVLAVTRQPQRQPVFDLTIDGVHEFVANGVLVHNSMDALRYLCVGVFGDVIGEFRPPTGEFDDYLADNY